MITTSEVAVSLTIESSTELKAIVRELEPFGSIEVEENHTIVSIVGNELATTPDLLSKLFSALTSVPIRMVSYGGSKHNVSLLIPSAHKTETLQLLNKGLFGLA
jgi:aspartate kinase